MIISVFLNIISDTVLWLTLNIIFSMILFVLFNYHIACRFSVAQIRFLAVPDLLSGLRRAAARQHKM
ncbi:hypothetical protein F3563_16200 [Salmonella enterica subsp. enterica]|nr:hypothetical protein [Salmonella enterica subsp. enterica]